MDGGISRSTANLYDEPYPSVPSNSSCTNLGAFNETIAVGIGVTALVPNGVDQRVTGLYYENTFTAPDECIDDMVNYCAELCNVASNCTAFNAYIEGDGFPPNPFDELGGTAFHCTF